MALNSAESSGGSQPPRNMSVASVDTRIMFMYSPRKKQGERGARVLDVETGDDLRLALGDVERRAVRLRHRRDEVDEEHREERQPVPGEEVEPHPGEVAARLHVDDVAEVEALRDEQHAHQREPHGDLVGDDLRRRAHRAEERVLRVRRPAGDDHAVDAHRRDRHHVEQAGVHVGEHHAGAERDHRPRRHRRHQHHHRAEQEQELVRAGRDDHFLEHQLEDVGERLQQPERPDPVRADAHLHVADHLALGEASGRRRRGSAGSRSR